MNSSIRRIAFLLALGGYSWLGLPSANAQDGPRGYYLPQATYRLGVNGVAVPLNSGLIYNANFAFQITFVEPFSPAQRGGLEVGDLIVTANGQSIQSPDDLRQAVAFSGGVLRLTVRDVRSGQYVYPTIYLR
jgi:S1-C subfamily serine protease